MNSRFIYTSTIGSHPFLINSPYALQYPYYDGSPFLLTYPQLLKHHTPDHKEEDDAEVIKPMKEEESGKPLKLYSLGLPLQYHIPGPISLPEASQYHAQDELGQYQYGYNNPLSSKNEIKTFDGITRGSYSYLDSEGICAHLPREFYPKINWIFFFFSGEIQTVNYVSDALGFRVVATNLPKAVDIPDSLEIVEAKKQHFKAHQDHIDLLAKSKDETKNE